MARFEIEIPKDILNEIEAISKKSDKIFEEMTKAGAEVVEANVRANAPESLKKSKIMNCLKITKPYRTADGGINTKIGVYDYFINHKGYKSPAPVVARAFEYGSTKVNKQPFFRKSFNKAQIKKAMLEAQKRESGGLLK